MSGQHLPPDPSKGDEGTVGGYAAVHARPVALEGRDGMSYSLEILTDSTGMPTQPFGAYLLFVQWKRIGQQGVSGHLETEFLVWGETAAQARLALWDLPLAEAQRLLDALIMNREGTPVRRWWDVMRDTEGGE